MTFALQCKHCIHSFMASLRSPVAPLSASNCTIIIIGMHCVQYAICNTQCKLHAAYSMQDVNIYIHFSRSTCSAAVQCTTRQTSSILTLPGSGGIAIREWEAAGRPSRARPSSRTALCKFYFLNFVHIEWNLV